MIKNPYKARHYQTGGDVGRLYGTVDAPLPVYEALHSGGQRAIDRAVPDMPIKNAPPPPGPFIAFGSPQDRIPGSAEVHATRLDQARDAFGPDGQPQVYEGELQARGLLPGMSLATTGLNAIANANIQHQRNLREEHGAGAMTLQSPNGYAVTVSPGLGGRGLVVSGNTEGIDPSVYIDTALRQGLAPPEGYDNLPGGSLGGPGGFAGAGGHIFDTAEEAARSLDRADAGTAAQEASRAAAEADRRAQATRDAVAMRQAEEARAAEAAANAEAKRQAAAHVHVDDDGGRHDIPAGRSAVTDNHGNAVTDSGGNAVTSRNRGGGGDDGGGGGGGGGRWCCSAMVHAGLWSERREFARMTSWSLRKFAPKHAWWLSGYNSWGKVVAKHIVKRTSWGKDLMQAFYDYHVEDKPYSFKTFLAQAIIFPGAFIASKLGAVAPSSFRIAQPEEI